MDTGRFRAFIVCELGRYLTDKEFGNWVNLDQPWEKVDEDIDAVLQATSPYYHDDRFIGEYIVTQFDGFGPLELDEDRVSLDLAHDIVEAAMNDRTVLDVIDDELSRDAGWGRVKLDEDLLKNAADFCDRYLVGSFDNLNGYLHFLAESMLDREIDEENFDPDEVKWPEGFDPWTCLDNMHVIDNGNGFHVFDAP